jgi:20S proteasome subunit beta 3
MDGLGALTEDRQFAVVGTSNAGLYALCESFYRPDLPAEELIALVERCLKQAFSRDVMSGCDLRLFTLSADGSIYEKNVPFQDA